MDCLDLFKAYKKQNALTPKEKEELDSAVSDLLASFSTLDASFLQMPFENLPPSSLLSLPDRAFTTYLQLRDYYLSRSFKGDSQITFKFITNHPDGFEPFSIAGGTHPNFDPFAFCARAPGETSAETGKRNLRDLVILKNIFCTQLPRMPKEYIARVVFDPYHANFAMYKNGAIVGGITFRAFFTQRFVELVFCAVSNAEQVKGFGSRMMNAFKNAIKAKGLRTVLTFADNFAIGFFKKQGFTVSGRLPKEAYHHYIKNYDGSSQMECALFDEVDYERLREAVGRRQEEARRGWKREMGELCAGFGQAAGARAGEQDVEQVCRGFLGKGAAEGAPDKEAFVKEISFYLELYSKKMGLPREFLLKKLQESQVARSVLLEDESRREVNGKLAALLSRLKGSKHVWPFLAPVNEKQVLDYYTVVTSPMDLGTMCRKFSLGKYSGVDMFREDIQLIYDNCLLYNGEKSNYSECARKLLEEADSWIKENV